jgi:hypothetical protein
MRRKKRKIPFMACKAWYMYITWLPISGQDEISCALGESLSQV